MSSEWSFKIGNDFALQLIKDHYSNKLYELSNGLINDSEKAKQLVDEVFTSLWQMHDRFSSFEDVKSFLHITTRHISLRYLQQ